MRLNTKKVLISALVIISIVVVGLLLVQLMSSDLGISQTFKNVSRIELSIINNQTTAVPIITSTIQAPQMPKTMRVYKINRTISEADFMQIAKNLGMAGQMDKVDPFFILKNESYQLDVEPSLGIVNYKMIAPQMGYDSAYIEKSLPTDQDARLIADGFLDNSKVKPDGAEFSMTTHSEGYMTTSPPSKFSETINVDYVHDIDGYPVLTDQLTVKIGVDGDIINVFEKWVVPEPFNEYPIITTAEAFEYLEETGIVIPQGMEKPERAEVKSVYLAYIGETQAEYLEYLIPVYVFEGSVYGDGKITEFYQYIPASPEAVAQLI